MGRLSTQRRGEDAEEARSAVGPVEVQKPWGRCPQDDGIGGGVGPGATVLTAPGDRRRSVQK